MVDTRESTAVSTSVPPAATPTSAVPASTPETATPTAPPTAESATEGRTLAQGDGAPSPGTRVEHQQEDLEKIRKQKSCAISRAKKIALKVHGERDRGDEKRPSELESELLQLTCFRCIHRYYDPTARGYVGQLEEWPVVALGAVFLSCKISGLPKRAKILMKFSEVVASDEGCPSHNQDLSEKDHNLLVDRFLGVESQMLHLLGFDFACEQWSPKLELEKRISRLVDHLFELPEWQNAKRTVMQNSRDNSRKLMPATALRFYLQLAETHDVGNFVDRPYFLDAVIVMAYKYFIKGAQFAEKPPDIFALILASSQVEDEIPASPDEQKIASEGAAADGRASPKEGNGSGSRTRLLLNREAEAANNTRDPESESLKRARAESNSGDGQEAKSRKIDCPRHRALKEQVEFVMKLFRSRGSGK